MISEDESVTSSDESHRYSLEQNNEENPEEDCRIQSANFKSRPSRIGKEFS